MSPTAREQWSGAGPSGVGAPAVLEGNEAAPAADALGAGRGQLRRHRGRDGSLERKALATARLPSGCAGRGRGRQGFWGDGLRPPKATARAVSP